MCCFYLVRTALALSWSGSALLRAGRALGSIHLDHPLLFPPPTCAAEQVCKKSIRTALGWTDHVSCPPWGERSLELWVTTAIWKTQRRRVLTARWASEMHVYAAARYARCVLACQELKMQRVSFSHQMDNAPDKNALIVELQQLVDYNQIVNRQQINLISFPYKINRKALVYWSDQTYHLKTSPWGRGNYTGDTQVICTFIDNEHNHWLQALQTIKEKLTLRVLICFLILKCHCEQNKMYTRVATTKI